MMQSLMEQFDSFDFTATEDLMMPDDLPQV